MTELQGFIDLNLHGLKVQGIIFTDMGKRCCTMLRWDESESWSILQPWTSKKYRIQFHCVSCGGTWTDSKMEATYILLTGFWVRAFVSEMRPLNQKLISELGIKPELGICKESSQAVQV